MQTLSQKLITKHQWLVHMGSVILDTSKTVATEMEIQFLNTWIMFHRCCHRFGSGFFCLKKGVSQYFCLYSVCTSHWCLVMSCWLKVCIYSHTRGVKLGLGLGFMQTSQVLPHWLNQSFSFWTLSYTQRHCHVRIEKGPVQTVAIILEAHFPIIICFNIKIVLIEITKVVKPVH